MPGSENVIEGHSSLNIAHYQKKNWLITGFEPLPLFFSERDAV